MSPAGAPLWRSTRPGCRILLASVVVTLCSSCGGILLGPGSAIDSDADLVVVAYLCGDGDLASESRGILARLEAVDREGTGIEILALLDQPEGASFYRVLHDPSGGGEPASVRLSLPDAKLERDEPAHLAMGGEATLAALLERAEELFHGAPIALVVSGAGRAYRSSCRDVYPADELSTIELARALAGSRTELVILDASFSASIEVAYELSSVAPTVRSLVAAEGRVPAEGFPYGEAMTRAAQAVRNGHEESGDLAGLLAESLLSTVAGSGAPDRTISLVDLAAVGSVSRALDEFARALAMRLSSSELRDEVRSLIFYEVADFYATPGDLAVDLADLALQVSGTVPEVATHAEALVEEIDRAVRSFSGPDHADARGINAHLIPLLEDGRAAPAHDPDYTRGGATPELRFVSTSFWVPAPLELSGLLYRLFYEEFPES